MRRFMVTLLLIGASALFLSGCGEDTPTTPTDEPSASPTPTPTPTPDPCEIRRVDMIAERQDGKNAGQVVEAWPVGVNPRLSVIPKFAGDFMNPRVSVSECPQLDKVTWGFDGASTARCFLLGNETAPSRSINCQLPGNITVFGQVQGIGVDAARATFRIQPGSASASWSDAQEQAFQALVK